MTKSFSRLICAVMVVCCGLMLVKPVFQLRSGSVFADPQTYTITYYLNGGVNNALNPITFTDADAITLLSPTKTGYSFAGWYEDELFESVIAVIAAGTSQNYSLYAKWSANYYNLSFSENGGEEVTNISAYFDSVISLPTPVRTGYRFVGWYPSSNLSGTAINYTTMPESQTLYAKWSVNSYKITFEENGGSTTPDINVPYSAQMTLPVPAKNNYVFDGWYMDAEFTTPATIDSMPASNITLYAKWSYDIASLAILVGIISLGTILFTTTIVVVVKNNKKAK